MRARIAAIVLVAAGVVAAVGQAQGGSGRSSRVPVTTAPPGVNTQTPALAPPAIRWRRSRAVGKPFAGRLVRGVQLPAEGRDFFSWDLVKRRRPDRAWRRWGHDRTIRTLLSVVREYRARNPTAPRVGIADLSRHRGGWFGKRYGGIGHASHQNGLDVDIPYPRLDGTERAARRPRQVDRALAQSLLDVLVAHHVRYVFVGPHTGLRGPKKIVETLNHHGDHMHVRLRARRGGH
jgi:murein endopeptidase